MLSMNLQCVQVMIIHIMLWCTYTCVDDLSQNDACIISITFIMTVYNPHMIHISEQQIDTVVIIVTVVVLVVLVIVIVIVTLLASKWKVKIKRLEKLSACANVPIYVSPEIVKK